MLDMERVRDASFEGLRQCIFEGRMTQPLWQSLTPATREAVRDNSMLSPQLIGLEGHRVAIREADQESVLPNRRKDGTRTFIVGRSTGWRPVHLEIANVRSSGGSPAAKSYDGLRDLGKVR